MTPRAKKLIGTVLILIWLPVYAVTAMRIGVALLPDAGSLATLAYYAIAGAAWVVPIALIFPWMSREPQQRR